MTKWQTAEGAGADLGHLPRWEESGFGTIENYVLYTVVTVDQPCFAVVWTLTESQTPDLLNVTPLIELNVAINSVF